MSKRPLGVAVILVTALFFLWGFALNLNPILIPHLKKACQLSDIQSSLIDASSYLAYFFMALPAGLFMKRYGYKKGILTGLLLFAAGALLFYPAASLRWYAFFLAAIFIIACGCTFLESAANPYMTELGEMEQPGKGIHLLNFAQSFNGLAACLAPLLGRQFILSGTTFTEAQLKAMPTAALQNYLQHEAGAVQIPYLLIGLVVLGVALVCWRTALPEAHAPQETRKLDWAVLKQPNLRLGVIAQFFYVGAQVSVSSFFIRFAWHAARINEKNAALLLSFFLLAFMSGRFIGTVLMRFIAPARLLLLYSIINILLLVVAIFARGYVAVYALGGVEFFMSVMYPTIFALSIRGLGHRSKEGTSFLVMAIAGGAVFPVLLGYISDLTQNIQWAYAVPAVCFMVVSSFAIKNIGVKQVTLSTAH
ncbi:MFS transporter, FHS family, L-fucose permease [Chitinophaga costaii]|uniref:MFS transporter, FHS family, L-fucose permease n=1 Tax=Chitinophaga costaii TaxID=1335309 RepID=A0A1C4CP02_9BACT|nr:L-fucose:H+ symporter permease [Chitinophaga costaii]PUZ27292.1 L-fucose:H+ symporter permease [Chitinophaga costaii]SCC20759.1 MFS transporter, FHS family, L-fucose permease [Chitinophaga costaii]